MSNSFNTSRLPAESVCKTSQMGKVFTEEDKRKFALKMAFKRGIIAAKTKNTNTTTNKKIGYNNKYNTYPRKKYTTSIRGNGRYYPRYTPPFYFPMSYIKGAGKYKEKEITGEGTGRKVGKALGEYLGKGMGSFFGKITGWGEYNVNENSLLNGGMKPPELINHMNAENGCIVRHREYIGDVVNASTFTIQTFPINAGLVQTFPWLSQIAGTSFQQYRFTGLIFEYKSMSSDAVLSTNTSSALGAVMGAVQYDSNEPPFIDKKTMDNYEFTVSTKPSCDAFFPVECKPSQTPIQPLYTRSGAVPSGGDIKTFDMGIFSVAVQGTQGSNSVGVLGEIWATYECILYKSKLTEGQGTTLLTDHYQISGTMDATHPFGTTSSLVSGSNIGTSITPTTLTFPSFVTDGNYMLIWEVKGTAGNNVAPAITVNANITSLSLWKNDTANSITIGGGDGIAATLYILYTFQILGPSGTITFGTGGTFPSAITAGDIWIMQINSNIKTLMENKEEELIEKELNNMKLRIKELNIESEDDDEETTNKKNEELDKLEKEFIKNMLEKLNKN